MEPQNDIIVAPATLSGGAISIVRLSGSGSIELVSKMFSPHRGDALCNSRGYTLHYGLIKDGDEVVDDVMISLFRTPHSYTSEDSVEISCHGSSYIVGRIICLALAGGARMASEGEFTIRAFMAGRLDLSQAEAVADMISSSNKAMHTLATRQMRGGYSEKLGTMRESLLHLSSMLELELDFGEEDVEFANREELAHLMTTLESEIEKLVESFKVGNALKRGVAVAIIGAPNAGKSTLLNRVLGEDRAMVSDVAGTTRDTIEEVVVIDGIAFRFIDTAGLHDSDDSLEVMGMERTKRALGEAQIILQIVDVCDLNSFTPLEVEEDQHLIVVVNKIDTLGDKSQIGDLGIEHIAISAKGGEGVEHLTQRLRSTIDLSSLNNGDLIVSNARHYDHLRQAATSLRSAHTALLEGLSIDLLSEDLRHTLHHIGAITGSITTDEILGRIFSSFCIGK